MRIGLLVTCITLVSAFDFGLDEAGVRFINTPSDGTQHAIGVTYTDSQCYKCTSLPLIGFIATNTTSDYVEITSRHSVRMTLVWANNNNETLYAFDVHEFGPQGLYTISITHSSTTGFATTITTDKKSVAIYEPIYISFTVLLVSFLLWNISTYFYVRYNVAQYTSATERVNRLLYNYAASDLEPTASPTKDYGTITSSPGLSYRGQFGGTPTGTSPKIVRPSQRDKMAAVDQQTPFIDRKGNSRIQSLDAFRGISLTIMVFVNYGAGGYWFFDHSAWNGITIADLVFPWFIMIMGTSMALSFDGIQQRYSRRSDANHAEYVKMMIFKIAKRSLILFALGLFLNNGKDLSHWRIPGVLQRFGVSYFVVGLIMLIPASSKATHSHSTYLKKKASDLNMDITEIVDDANIDSPPSYFADITDYFVQWLVVAALAVLWILITFLLPVSGCPTGYLGAGGLEDFSQHFDCTGGAARYIDVKIFGLNHIYHKPTCRDLYHCKPHDPEGLLGCLTSCVLVFFGVQIGRILLYWRYQQKATYNIVFRWLIWAVLLGSIALLLTGGTMNGGILPINKNLWSLSFIFTCASIGLFLLALLYITIDVFPLWNGAPVVYMGMNSILVYCGSDVFQGYFPFSFDYDESQHLPAFLSAMLGAGYTCCFLNVWTLYILISHFSAIVTGLWLIISYYLYTIRYFVKI